MYPIKAFLENHSSVQSLLTPELDQRYGGPLWLPAGDERPYVFANFVSSADGVVSYCLPGHSTGGDISRGHPADRLVMGILRSAADAVVIGAATAAAEGGPPRTAEEISPEDAGLFRRQRERQERTPFPLQVVITGRGVLDAEWPVLNTPSLRVVVLTTRRGAERVEKLDCSSKFEVRSPEGGLTPASILRVLREEFGVSRCLLEGGPSTFGEFLRSDMIDELFLSISPIIAGRGPESSRPGIVDGCAFSPEESPELELITLKESQGLLLTRWRVRHSHLDGEAARTH